MDPTTASGATGLGAGTAAAGVFAGGILLSLLTSAFFRRFVARLTRHTQTELDDILVRRLRFPVSASVAIGATWYATSLMNLMEPVAYVTTGVLLTTAVVLWTVAMARIVGEVIDWASDVEDHVNLINSRTRPVFDFAGRAAVYGAAVYFLFLAWNVDLTGWLASAGIVGIAVGFAARDTLANLFAGVFILADAPYKLGDYLIIGTGERGRVTEIGIRATRILTRDDVEIIVPNAVMANAKIINESGGPYEAFRVRATVECAYGTDVDLVREVMMACSKGVPGVVDSPEPRVRFREFAASGLQFQLLCWVERPELRGRVVDTLNTRIYKAFADSGIEIPYSKLDVFLRRETEGPDPREGRK